MTRAAAGYIGQQRERQQRQPEAKAADQETALRRSSRELQQNGTRDGADRKDRAVNPHDGAARLLAADRIHPDFARDPTQAECAPRRDAQQYPCGTLFQNGITNKINTATPIPLMTERCSPRRAIAIGVQGSDQAHRDEAHGDDSADRASSSARIDSRPLRSRAARIRKISPTPRLVENTAPRIRWADAGFMLATHASHGDSRSRVPAFQPAYF
jgi:hypothetical protein